ncbi:MAG TPA: polysaccharide deacetylase family protein [Myxococcales bacterium]|nr:polysaccharide deacetylase family protein [Myxococcales bacterium]
MERSARWKLWCKEVAARTLVAAGLTRANTVAQRMRLGGRRTLIVSYHRVVADFEKEVARSIPGLLVSTRALQDQLEELGRRYDVVPLAIALHEMRSQAPGRDLAAVSFDDGYADVLREGLPILKRLHVPATVFLVAGYVGSTRPLPHDRLHACLSAFLRHHRSFEALPPSLARDWLAALMKSGCSVAEAVDGLIAALPDAAIGSLATDLESVLGTAATDLLPGGSELLTWDMIRELLGAGVAIGAHTVRHRVLTHLALSEVRWELREARARIRAHAGADPVDFAYPNGWYSDAVVREVVAAGYRSAVTTEARHNGPGADPFCLGRYTLWEGSTRGPVGYSKSIAACQLDGSFRVLGIPRMVSGHVNTLPVREARGMPNLQGPEGQHA